MSEPFRYVRIVATDLANPKAPLVIDVLLNEAGQIKDKLPYAGWWGHHKSTETWPFVAKKIDDTYMLDFGSDATTKQADRYELFNLFDHAIKVGLCFKQKYGDDWYSFRVSQIVDMIAGKEL